MATGDKADMLARIKSVLPTGWFSDSSPVLDSLLSGPAWMWAWLYDQIQYVRQQARIATVTGSLLDMAASDFLGERITRREGQGDTPFRLRVQSEILRPRNTREAMHRLLVDLTGREPRIFEPSRPADTGGYGVACGYGVAGGWGSLQLPGQVFVDIFRDLSSGVPAVAGYGSPIGGYGVGSIEWASLDMISGNITDADLFLALDGVKPAGTTIWARVLSDSSLAGLSFLTTDSDLITGDSTTVTVDGG